MTASSQRGDARQDAGVHQLSGPREFTPLPREEIEALAAIKRRSKLLRSPLYERLAERLFEVTYALIHRPAPQPPPLRSLLIMCGWLPGILSAELSWTASRPTSPGTKSCSPRTS